VRPIHALQDRQALAVVQVLLESEGTEGQELVERRLQAALAAAFAPIGVSAGAVHRDIAAHLPGMIAAIHQRRRLIRTRRASVMTGPT